jgi:hypothetical protein
MMACVLLQKHPELSSIIRGNKWLLKTLAWQLRVYIQPHVPARRDWLETHMMHAASALEWQSHQLLDSLYIRLLSYFYSKGMIIGAFGESERSERVQELFAGQTLVPLMALIQRDFSEASLSLPEGYGSWIT